MKKIVETWKLLNKTIYVGERLKTNLLVLTMISIVTAILSLILIFINIFFIRPDAVMTVAAVATFASGAAARFWREC